MANWSVVEGLTECRVPGKEAAARACGARWVPPASVALLATRKPLSVLRRWRPLKMLKGAKETIMS